jgi:hypothetical protein
MKYKLTLLNIAAFLFLIGCGLYTFINYSVLSGGEGWGMLMIIVFGAFGVGALIIDLLIQIFVKSKDHQTILGAIVIAIIAVLLCL